MSSHTLLSPSSAHRWLECTPSAALEATLPPHTSTYAEEGTLAHSIAAAYVNSDIGIIDDYSYAATVEEAKKSDLWDYDMVKHAHDYSLYIASLRTPDTIYEGVEVEGLSLEPWVPGCKGTADYISFDGRTLNVVDFKYGRGVVVDAANNPQLKLYALGAINYINAHAVKDLQVVLHVYQPRVQDGVNAWSISGKDLMEWAERYVEPRSAMALKGIGDYRPAKETCLFCRAKPVCRALSDDVFRSVTPQTQAQIDSLTLEEVAQALKKASMFKSWLAALEEHLKAAMLAGKTVTGFKLVEGRANRKITDPRRAAELLRQAGFDDAMTHRLTLIGLTDLEKLVGKRKLPEVLQDTLVKPTGSPTMVEDDDPRPAMAVDAAVMSAFAGAAY